MTEHQIIFFLAWFAAGFVNGVSGMGAAMVAVPIVVSFMPPPLLTPSACIIVAGLSAHMAWNFKEGCRLASLKNLFIGAIPGSLAGLSILLFIPARFIQLLTGIVMVLFVAWQCMRKDNTKQRPETLGKSLGTGFASGLLNTSISFGNPPLGVYALHLGWSQMDTVGTVNLFSLLASLVACVMQASAGLYTTEVLTWAAIGLPASMCGIVCSMPVARRIHAVTFKRILLLVIALGGVACVWRGLAF